MVNDDTWFFSIKINGELASVLHFSYGITGFIIDYLVYEQKRVACVLATVLFVFITISFRSQ